jgi:MFS family permease
MKATKLAARAGRKPAEDKEKRIDRLYRKDWNPRRVLAGYFSVYITEGMVRSIMFILPLYLLTAIAGLSALQIGFILIMAYVPWHFKFLLGFGMDRCGSIGSWRRRIYIILGTFITVAGVLWLSNTTLLWFGILPAIIMVMGGDALIDTGMDALLLDVTPPDWHGTGIGVGWGARAIGYTLSLVLTMIVHSLWGWGPVLYLFALYALPALLAIVIHEPACSSERQISRRSLAETFTDRRIVGWIGFAFLGAFVYVLDPTRGFLALIINPITGGGSATIFSAGIAFGLFAAAASFITGRLIDRIGHKRGYFISLALAFLAVLLWALVPPANMLGLLVYSAILGTFSAFCMVSWFSVLADTVPPNFTAFMWQYDMGYLHVAAFVSGIIIGVLGTGQLALLGLGLLMLLGFIPAKLIKSSRNSKGEIS